MEASRAGAARPASIGVHFEDPTRAVVPSNGSSPDGSPKKSLNNKINYIDPDVKASVIAIDTQLKEHAKLLYKFALIHPTESKLLPWWDAVATFALIFTALVTPWETAFVTANVQINPWGEPWFLINRVVDIIFLADMIFQFFIMFPMEQRSATSQILYVTNRWEITKHCMSVEMCRTYAHPSICLARRGIHRSIYRSDHVRLPGVVPA